MHCMARPEAWLASGRACHMRAGARRATALPSPFGPAHETGTATCPVRRLAPPRAAGPAHTPPHRTKHVRRPGNELAETVREIVILERLARFDRDGVRPAPARSAPAHAGINRCRPVGPTAPVRGPALARSAGAMSSVYALGLQARESPPGRARQRGTAPGPPSGPMPAREGGHSAQRRSGASPPNRNHVGANRRDPIPDSPPDGPSAPPHGARRAPPPLVVASIQR